MSIRRAVAIAVIVASATLLIACRGGDGSAPPPPSPSAAPSTVEVVATPTTAPVAYAPAGPATFTVLGGKAQGPFDIEQFMPALIHIREGDTVEWASSGIEAHTVSFVDAERMHAMLSSFLVTDPEDPDQQFFNPDVELKTLTGDTFNGDGTYVNSGSIGALVEQKYRLTFTRRGVYQYVCLIHPFWMRGTVSVDAPEAQVEAPEVVAARGAAEFKRFVEEEQRALRMAGELAREVPGPDGTRVHRVAVGVTTPYGQATSFVSPKLDIKTGDTVIFENDERNFHNVVFKGSRPYFPPGIAAREDPGGRGFIFGLSKESAIAVGPPPGGFDATTFLSSGSMGVLLPRTTWRLTFDRPGTYVYNCTIHALAGMAGVIIVTQR